MDRAHKALVQFLNKGVGYIGTHKTQYKTELQMMTLANIKALKYNTKFQRFISSCIDFDDPDQADAIQYFDDEECAELIWELYFKWERSE